MKKAALIVVVLMAISLIAQTANQFSMITPNAAVTGCPTPVSGSNILCSVTDGYYVSVSGGTYAKINVGASQSGVVTYNNRSGNVLSANGDYSFSMLSGQLAAAQMPSSLTCTVSLSVGNGQAQTAQISSCK